jgi:hypothetical protein
MFSPEQYGTFNGQRVAAITRSGTFDSRGLSHSWDVTFYQAYFQGSDEQRMALILHEILHALGDGFTDAALARGLPCKEKESPAECLQRNISEKCKL